MSLLSRFSEPYPPTGGMASEGVRNLLGRPSLEPLELLVREAIQNSWDAKREDRDHIDVAVALSTLTRAQRTTLTSDLLPDPPPRLPLAKVLAEGELQLLTFTDRGTVGLEGGIRSDATRDGEPSDFVDFVRNIGQPPDREFGGGSFGYGKGAFYLLSRASTILVHTRCRTDSGLETRLIACALGEHYSDRDGVRRTGRHWWGAMDGAVVDPLIGADGDRLAGEVGLSTFEGEETGTTIAIVAPMLELTQRVDDEHSEVYHGGSSEAMEFIAETITWNFWPKMISIGERPIEMRFEVESEGCEVSVPGPDTHPRLQLFTSALRTLKGEEIESSGLGGAVEPALCHRPRQRVGTVAIRMSAIPQLPPETSMPPSAKSMRDGLHHVALMRQANLIVRYEAGPPLASDRVGYAGVFECDAEVDQAFRQAEPPTHDRWEPKYLEKPERTFVRVALKRIREITEAFTAPTASRPADASDLAVGEFSSELASLIPAAEGPGAAISARPIGGVGSASSPSGGGMGSGNGSASGGDRGSSGSRGGEAAASILVVESARPIAVDEETVVQMKFQARGRDDTGSFRVSVKPVVMTLDGGAVEREPPEGAATPAVIRWISPEGAEYDSAEVEITNADDGVWTVHLTHLPDVVLQVELLTGAA